MKIITSLIDFTDTSKLANEYACHFAKKDNGKVNLLHIASGQSEDTTNLEKKLAEFSGMNECGLEYSVSIGDGDYMRQVPKLVQMSNSDLVIIGTHGTKGIFQTLFGANVVKMVQSIPIPALVIQDHSPKPKDSKRILFPIAPHENFQIKIDATAKWAKTYSAQVEIFCLLKQDSTLPDNLKRNIEKAKTTFEENGVDFKVTMQDSVVYSVGYAREILEYAEKHEFDLITIMSHNSEENLYFGNVDKTNIILNKAGIPVLCIGS